MKALGKIALGIILFIIGCIVFLMNITVTNFSLFYRVGKFNIGALILVLTAVWFVVVCVKPTFRNFVILAIAVVVFIVQTVLTIDVRVNKMSVFELLVILLTIGGGIGLTLNGLFNIKSSN